MGKKLENAKRLYLEGIRDGNIEVVKSYTGDRYTQHSTGVADGTAGFIAFFEGFLQRTNTRDIQLIRTIEDGQYVFVHAYQNIDNGTAQWITTDLFDTDQNDKIIEHWDVIAPYEAPEEKTGNIEMILGDFELKELDQTEANKSIIRKFLVDIFQNKNHHLLDHYISNKSFVNHSITSGNTFAKFSEYLATQDPTYDFVFKVIGQGDHVVSYSKVHVDNDEFAVFDIFRLQEGKIVEHWENAENIPPRHEWANTGKF